jgi:hypothetical protein
MSSQLASFRTKGVVATASLLACFASACTTNSDEPGTGAGGAGGNGLELVAFQAEAGVAQDITLTVHSNGWGTELGTVPLAVEGPAVISFEEAQPYSDPAEYYIYAEAAGFYTKLYGCAKGDTIQVDLDAVPVRENAIAGVIFGTQSYFAPSYLANATIALAGPGIATELVTDSEGRFGLEGLPLGTYSLSFPYQTQTITLELLHDSEGTDYTDLYFDEPMQAS